MAGNSNWHNEKADFFRQLDFIHQDSDDDGAYPNLLLHKISVTRTGGGRSPLASSRGSQLLPVAIRRCRRTSSGSCLPVTPSTLLRTTSAPEAFKPSTPASNASRVKDTPLQLVNGAIPQHMRRVVTEPSPCSKSIDLASMTTTRAGGKRKRGQLVETVPEAQQIFKDKVFFFLPNNDTNAARRLRIAKAVKFGATWTRDWSEGVTHVIMDDHLDYSDLLKFLKVEHPPDSIVVANQKYIADCISYKTILSAKQKQYEVRGAPSISSAVVEKTTKQPTMDVVSGDVPKPDLLHMPLKPPGPAVLTRKPETPQNTSESMDRAFPAVPDERVYDDALDVAIAEAKGMDGVEHIDLEEETSEQSMEEAPSSDDDSSPQRIRPVSKLHAKSWQENFQCMHKHDGTSKSTNPNARIIEVLEQMAEYYDRIHDQWRTVAYRKAVASLRKQDRKIMFKEDAARLPFVGDRLAAKIEEIAWTDRLKRLQNALDDPRDQLLSYFTKIYGVGLSQANHWVDAGYKTLQDLQKYAKLSENQRIGITHFDDFNARIPRDEIEQHGRFVREALQQTDKDFEVTIMGSYRRGAKDSGDIDLIVTKPNADIAFIRSTIIDTLVPALTAQGFFKATLAKTHKANGTKWHGCSALPGHTTWRRIDLLLVPWEEMGAALIYFTGNDIFNRSIRLLASKKGMRLNQRGLYNDVLRGKGRERLTDGELIEGRSEKRIFEILGVPWRPPEHRIC